MEWLLYPLAVAVFAAAGICICLLLHVRLKRESRARWVELEQALARLEEELAGMRRVLDGLSERVSQLDAVAERVAGLPLAGSGLNLNKRSQAVRMLRRGEHPGRVAAALGLPEGEVSLLWKMCQLPLDPEGEPAP